MSDEGHRVPFHPIVAELLKRVEAVGDGRAQFPKDALASCRARLLNDAREDPTAFVHLLALWSQFTDAGFEPAAGQLYELMALLPELHGAKNREELLARAQTAAQAAGQDSGLRLRSGLVSPDHRGASIGARKPSKKPSRKR